MENNEIKAPDGALIEKRIHFLSIIGQIEGHYVLPEGQKATKYEHILPALAEAEIRDDVDGIIMLINTVGGDVEAGLAIAETVAGMTKPVVSLVLGGGHSIGVPLAVAARHSLIVSTATMTLHPVRVNGLVIGVPQSFESLNRMQDRIISFICKNSSVKEDKLRSLMMKTDEMTTDVGSIISGEEAVSIGLIDGVGGIGDAISALRKIIADTRQMPT